MNNNPDLQNPLPPDEEAFEGRWRHHLRRITTAGADFIRTHRAATAVAAIMAIGIGGLVIGSDRVVKNAANDNDKDTMPKASAVPAPTEERAVADKVSARCAINEQRVLLCVGPKEPLRENFEYLSAENQPPYPRAAANILLKLADGRYARSKVVEFEEETAIDFGTLQFDFDAAR